MFRSQPESERSKLASGSGESNHELRPIRSLGSFADKDVDTGVETISQTGLPILRALFSYRTFRDLI